MEFEELKSIIDKFFQDSTIIRINLRFNYYVKDSKVYIVEIDFWRSS